MTDKKNMPESMNAFLRKNVKEPDTTRTIHLERFTEIDENGEEKPVDIVLRALSADEQMELNKRHTKVYSDGSTSYDSKGAGFDLATKCMVYPDLFNAELQDSWGVTSETELLNAMFTGKEVNKILRECNDLNYGTESFDGQVEEIKNL